MRMPWLSAERQDNDRCFRMESWEEHFNSGRIIIQTPNGLRYIGTVKRLADGTVSVPEMNGNWQHVAEKSMGYLKKVLNDCGFQYRVLSRARNKIEASIP